jgi:hypothetical protein
MEGMSLSSDQSGGKDCPTALPQRKLPKRPGGHLLKTEETQSQAGPDPEME